MTIVVSLEDYRPSPRYDSLPWTDVWIQEGTVSDDEAWVTLETQALSPVDVDPANPAYRNFTTSLGTAEELWYRVVFLDALANTGLPTYPVQNVEDDRPVYASVSELAQLLKVNATSRHASLMRVLKMAAEEIDEEIGTVDINDATLPYSNPPALARGVNLERAVEHWQQGLSPFGIIGIGDLGATYTARDTWDRHAHKLSPLKASWGLACNSTVQEIAEAMAAQIQDALDGTVNPPLVTDLQVTATMNLNPTPPSIDIYPGDPFTQALAYGIGNLELMFTVRARVSTAESEGGQELLMQMMDPRADSSVLRAIEEEDTLGGVVDSCNVGDVSGFGVFPAPGGDSQNLLGCTWPVRVMP